MDSQSTERRSISPGSIESVVFSCVREGPPPERIRPLEPQTKYFNVPEVENYFERYTPNSNNSNKEWKSFEHFKRVRNPAGPFNVKHYTATYVSAPSANGAICLGIRSGPWAGAVPSGAGTVLDPFEGEEPFYNPESDGHFVRLPTNWNDLRLASLKTMLPQIKPELSLINSVIELRDLRSQVGRTLRNLSGFGRQLVGLSRKALTLRELLRVASDLQLQWSFNIQASLSDIAGIRRSLLRVEKQINDLITRANKPQKKYFRYFFREHEDIADEVIQPVYLSSGASGAEYPNWYGGYRQQRFVYYEVCEFHAVIEYTFRFAQYQTEHARLLGLLDALGVNLNPGVIWNGIPWTFVIDWVVNVGSWLDQFRVNNMEPQINIRNHSCSIKRHRWGFVQNKSCADTVWGVSGDTVPQPVVSETAYRRIVDLPTIASITSSGLSPKEVVLGAALILSQSRRKTRRSLKS